MIAEVRGQVGQLRESHHRIAQMIAYGWSESKIRRFTGVTSKRIALYRNDPAMQELIAHYSKSAEKNLEIENDFFTESSTLGRNMGVLIINEALEAHLDGERDISLSVVNKIVQDFADRTGYGKTSTVHHKHDFASALDRAIARSGKGEEVKLIEGQVTEAITLDPPLVPLMETTAPTAVEVSPDPPEPRDSRGSPNFAKLLGDSIKRRKFA